MLVSVLKSDFILQAMKTSVNTIFFEIFASIDSSDF